MVKMHNWRTKVVTLALIAGVTCTTLFSALFADVMTAHAQSDLQWAQSFASSQDIEMTSMSLSPIGEVVVAGTFHGTVDFDPGAGDASLSSGPSDTSFIAKYDAAGNYLWAYRLVGSGDVLINDIVVDSTSQIGVVGSFEGNADLDPGPGVFQATSKGGHDIFLLRLHHDGTLQWGWTAGDGDDDVGYGITTDSRSALYITGKFEGRIFWQGGESPVYEWSSVGGTDIFAARFNAFGTLFWIRTWGGEEDDSGSDLGLDSGDNVFVVGTFAGEADLDPLWTSTEVRSLGRDDIFVSAMTQYGESRWSAHMGSTGTESNPQVLVEADGTFYVSGQFERTVNFFNTQGNVGATVDSRGQQDIFIARYGPAPARTLFWAYGIGGEQNETLAGIDQDGFGNLYVLGTFSGLADVELGAAVTEVGSSGGTDIFLGKYSRQGEFRRVQPLSNPQDDRASALAISNAGNVVIGGDFTGSIDLGGGLIADSGHPVGVRNLLIGHYARDTWTPLPLRSYLPGIQVAQVPTE